ncbi:MAG: phosphotransferase [bacterium]
MTPSPAPYDDIKQLLAEAGFPADFELNLLAGDASERDFYRVVFRGAPDWHPAAVVAMRYIEGGPEAKRIFLETRQVLEDAGVRVPRCYRHRENLVLLEDLGDETLERAVAGKEDAPGTEALFRRAIDTLLLIQFEPMRSPRPGCAAFGMAFDEEKLMWELDFFIENAIRVYAGRRMEGGDERFVRESFKEIARALAAEPRYFTHRDYHSRNLMVVGGGLGVVDFQDARLGPLQYDLVSLLQDAYVSLPEGLIEKIKRYYIDGASERLGRPVEEEDFERIYRLMTVQRSLKAAGSFTFLDCVKKKNRYLRHLPAALGHAYRAMDEAGWTSLREVLGRYIRADGDETNRSREARPE